jgi:hypothetical protein
VNAVAGLPFLLEWGMLGSLRCGSVEDAGGGHVQDLELCSATSREPVEPLGWAGRDGTALQRRVVALFGHSAAAMRKLRGQPAKAAPERAIISGGAWSLGASLHSRKGRWGRGAFGRRALGSEKDGVVTSGLAFCRAGRPKTGGGGGALGSLW